MAILFSLKPARLAGFFVPNNPFRRRLDDVNKFLFFLNILLFTNNILLGVCIFLFLNFVQHPNVFIFSFYFIL